MSEKEEQKKMETGISIDEREKMYTYKLHIRGELKEGKSFEWSSDEIVQTKNEMELAVKSMKNAWNLKEKFVISNSANLSFFFIDMASVEILSVDIEKTMYVQRDET